MMFLSSVGDDDDDVLASCYPIGLSVVSRGQEIAINKRSLELHKQYLIETL